MTRTSGTSPIAACALLVAVLAPVAALAAGESAAAVPVPGTDLGAASLRAVGGLLLVLSILLGGFWLLKRFGARAGFGMQARGLLKVEGQLPIGPKKNIVVVRFLNKHLVLGVTDSSINLLTETEIGDDDTQPDFSQTLDKAQGDPR
ncbi:flagellar protein FliO/FliZ [Desulfobaculum xiamenense]|uniref:Flagellar protein n=1 Tax=Desulfobaculum xiamenense TaxID=995050 RepID=A0A846QGM4_9BACT|nr:flagellar biosynthetic protein FliO [Desulfobaculum xiamenense]NJB67946.1 flagellar protein FliO/FliZ [Desulfobaculum xiamenense]